MSVTDLAPTGVASTARRTAEILDHVLEEVREALARASVVPDLTDAASELRALASAAWEGAERIDPLAAEQIACAAAALVDAAAAEEPAASVSPIGPSGGTRASGYRPRHSASTPVVSPPIAPGGHEPMPLPGPGRRDDAAPRLALAAADAGTGVSTRASAPEAEGSAIAARLAALDALLSRSEHLLGGRSTDTPHALTETGGAP